MSTRLQEIRMQPVNLQARHRANECSRGTQLTGQIAGQLSSQNPSVISLAADVNARRPPRKPSVGHNKPLEPLASSQILRMIWPNGGDDISKREQIKGRQRQGKISKDNHAMEFAKHHPFTKDVQLGKWGRMKKPVLKQDQEPRGNCFFSFYSPTRKFGQDQGVVPQTRVARTICCSGKGAPIAWINTDLSPVRENSIPGCSLSLGI
ncbi:hypothetical protein J1N35_020730 [Gossypium stocksii]|uniref:Uncharacterized protein n=1 Tax=Gossypium stocksii TaxID=47602 RepID=A0A9D3VEI9_9ROSI|nr:hypothetical protein J1N35_020730 [Gossypium stocksii]